MQLFTHLLSSYLQGIGDFFSALAIPKGREFLLAVFGEIAVYSPFHHLGSSGLMIVGCITNDM